MDCKYVILFRRKILWIIHSYRKLGVCRCLFQKHCIAKLSFIKCFTALQGRKNTRQKALSTTAGNDRNVHASTHAKHLKATNESLLQVVCQGRNNFGKISGYKINENKSVFMGINIDKGVIERIHNTINIPWKTKVKILSH